MLSRFHNKWANPNKRRKTNTVVHSDEQSALLSQPQKFHHTSYTHSTSSTTIQVEQVVIQDHHEPNATDQDYHPSIEEFEFTHPELDESPAVTEALLKRPKYKSVSDFSTHVNHFCHNAWDTGSSSQSLDSPHR
jgi:hypothetical protein